MKNLLVSLVLFLIASGNCYAKEPTKLVIGTYNLRCLTSIDEERGDGWNSRKTYAAGLIQAHGFDIFGTQELRYSQLQDMLTLMPEYNYVGAGRDDGKQEGEHVAIFYSKDKFDLIKSGNFWLSEDENHPVKGWDAAYIRICTWAEFKVKSTGAKFVYFNVHLDNEGDVARQESAKMIMAKMNQLSPTLPAIMGGDFNVTENSSVYRLLSKSGKLTDAQKAAKIVYCNNSSYNDFKPEGSNEGVIDYLFLSKDFKVAKYVLLTDVYRSVDKNGKPIARTPSDHFPIMLQVELK